MRSLPNVQVEYGVILRRRVDTATVEGTEKLAERSFLGGFIPVVHVNLVPAGKLEESVSVVNLLRFHSRTQLFL
jgi:hypothetical protein